jgi:LemA protein
MKEITRMKKTRITGIAPVGPRSGSMMKGCVIAAVAGGLLLLMMGGCVVGKYNTIIDNEQAVEAKLTEIDNQYKRRSDLVPQLVSTVKGAANFEKSTITEVTEARASVGKMQLPSDIGSNPEALQSYLAAQSQLGSALSRLLVTVESYPELRATQNFLALQDQLEGTENRIAVARRDCIDVIQAYNSSIKRFPGNVIAGTAGFEKLPQLEIPGENLSEAPVVDFGEDG